MYCVAGCCVGVSQELQEAYRRLCEHFVVIASGEGSMPSISWVLEKAKAAKIQ